jgi:hypothetical protein
MDPEPAAACSGAKAIPCCGSTVTASPRRDPARRFTDYYPEWLDNLADEVTVEGSLLDGAVQGADAVRTILRHVHRELCRARLGRVDRCRPDRQVLGTQQRLGLARWFDVEA